MLAASRAVPARHNSALGFFHFFLLRASRARCFPFVFLDSRCNDRSPLGWVAPFSLAARIYLLFWVLGSFQSSDRLPTPFSLSLISPRSANSTTRMTPLNGSFSFRRPVPVVHAGVHSCRLLLCFPWWPPHDRPQEQRIPSLPS